MDYIKIKQVDAFTRSAFTGNPAAVVLDADHIDSKTMQNIAMEMNVSETVFIQQPEDPTADVKIRWFTPTQEVDLCGHATIAAFHTLAEEGRFGLQIGEPQSFNVETRSGILVVDVEWKNHQPYIKFSLPVNQFFPYPGDISTLCGAIGISEIELSQKVKPMITDSGYCYIPVSKFETLKTLEPNRAILAQLDELYDLKGFSVVTMDTGDKDIDWHLRFFAPELGVFEDPVTGSANGPMAIYLYLNGLVDVTQNHFEFRSEQGHFVNRTGHVDVLLNTDEEGIKELVICGVAVTVMDAHIYPRAGKAIKF